MLDETLQEARRQIEICNACRYCEGFCSVFPALTRQRTFADGDISQLANLCHNCRGCHYACQFTAPHEFDLNLPGILAEVRSQSWEDYAWPGGLARLFQRSGVALVAAFAIGFALLLWAANGLGATGGEGFYAVLSHNAMVAIFAPAFVLPLISAAISVRRYWADVGGKKLRLGDLQVAIAQVSVMKDLSGGQGQGCNFEKEDRYSNRRRIAHQAVLFGFLLCFAATSAGTIMHYLFAAHAPYPLFSLPKLLGVPGGVLLTLGCIDMAWMKLKADRSLGAASRWGGEMAFVVLLGFVAASGLMLYAATGTALVAPLLALHLGAVLTLFLLLPYSKMVHGLFRVAALLREAQSARS